VRPKSRGRPKGRGRQPVRRRPDQVAAVDAFLIDWLPRKAHLDAADRAALPGALRAWVRFALERRDVPAEWITPVVDAVNDALRAINAENMARTILDR